MVVSVWMGVFGVDVDVDVDVGVGVDACRVFVCFSCSFLHADGNQVSQAGFLSRIMSAHRLNAITK